MSTSAKEQDLLKGLANNDKTAIETIYADNYSLIQHFIVNNNGNEDDARDIFQESLIVLYENARSPEFSLNCQIRTYIYSVARRLWLKKLQYARRFEAQVENLEETVPVEEDLGIHEKMSRQYGIMRGAMGKIGEPCKSLLEAFYVHHKNMNEIASFFGYTNADNAKNQKYKCLMRLKKLFFAQYKNGN
ncbi:sigma-70 family RNA polymerase sigma factor [Pollutibacter soli]|uniref:RNA polymerase sigma factor n=1 Tax=Pollutibacter soli TaxID=3034157 RepID=UPI003013C93A